MGRRYLLSDRGLPALSPGEERECFRTLTTADCDRLVRAHLGYIIGQAQALIGLAGPSLTEDDLVQVGQLRMVELFQTFDPGRGVRFLTYAGPSIRRVMLDEVRASTRRPPEGVGPSAPLDPEALLLAAEQQEQLERAVSSLPEPRRSALRALCGLRGPVATAQEVAQRWGVCRQTVRNWKGQARRALQEIIQQN